MLLSPKKAFLSVKSKNDSLVTFIDNKNKRIKIKIKKKEIMIKPSKNRGTVII